MPIFDSLKNLLVGHNLCLEIVEVPPNWNLAICDKERSPCEWHILVYASQCKAKDSIFIKPSFDLAVIEVNFSQVL